MWRTSFARISRHCIAIWTGYVTIRGRYLGIRAQSRKGTREIQWEES
jgi:hypothetical protein